MKYTRPHLPSAILHFTFLFTFFLFKSTFSYSQSDVLKYARQIIDTLTSPSMHGRGYVKNGESIAAEYIKNEFAKLKLKSFGVNYYQSFSFPVNIFPEDFGLGFQNPTTWLENGAIVLIEASSPTTPNTSCKVVWLDSTTLSSKSAFKRFEKNNFSDKVIVIDPKGVTDKAQLESIKKAKQNPYNAKSIVVFNNKKLTWDISQTVASFPAFEVLVPDSLNTIRHKQFETLSFYSKNKFISSYESQNVIGYIKGSQYPDSFIVFSAHYDHLGHMGKDTYFPGANDNASGCAMMLSLAKYYSEHPPKYSVVFMAFSAEEVGLLGSKHYVEHPLFPISQIKFLINMDIMGTGDEGIMVVNATVHTTEFDELVRINETKKLLPAIKPRGKAAISDHYFFEEAGVKTFFTYTLGGIKAYHDIYDKPETLPLTKFEETYQLLIQYSEYLQK